MMLGGDMSNWSRTMKLIHLTDIHITLKGEIIQGKDPYEHFAQAIAHINNHHADADLAVITGDLTNWGEIEAYRRLQDLLETLTVPERLLIGNHDDRANFCSVFDTVPVDDNGFIQYAEDTGIGRFLYLDTVEPGTHAGFYGPERVDWLSSELERAADRPVYIFMHHPPMRVHSRPLDMIGLKDEALFRGVIEGHRDHIRHIFFGHCHLSLAGSYLGIPFSSLRGTNHQSWVDFDEPELLTSADLTPAYGVVIIQQECVVCHSIDFTYDGEITTVTTHYDDWQKTA